MNTIIWVLISGCRWADVPKGTLWGSRSTSHRWLGEWQQTGVWHRLVGRLLTAANLAGLIDWTRASIDGAFAAGKGGGEDVEYGFKGKGVTLHTMVDGNGDPLVIESTGAKCDERMLVEPLLDEANRLAGSRKTGKPAALQVDKGYESVELRRKIRKRGIKPLMPKRQGPNGKARRGRPPHSPIDRWKVERAHAWMQRKFRRLAVRWERRNPYWRGFIALALCLFWTGRILG
jgi:transposase